MPAPTARTPKAKTATAAASDRCTRRGAGGRAANASVIGIRATAWAGHHAAMVAVATASPMPITGSQKGTFQGSMRWAAAGSRAGAEANQASRPTDVPATAAVTPTKVPLATMARRRWDGVAPAAASMPSWRMRRCASVAKLAPATRHTRTIAHGGDDEHADGSGGLFRRLPRLDEAVAGRDAGPEAGRALVAGVDEQGERLGGLAGREHAGVLVGEVGGVLDDADDSVSASADVDLIAEARLEIRGRPIGEGRLADLVRAPTLDDLDHGVRERPVGLDRTELDGRRGAGDRDGLVPDDLDGAEPLLGLCDIRRDVVGSRDGVLETMVG